MKSIRLTIYMGILVLFFLLCPVEVTKSYSDQLSNTIPNTWSYHTIGWQVNDPDGILPGEIFRISFDSDFDLININSNDINIMIDNIGYNAVNACGSGDDISIGIVNNEITFSVCPSATAINQNDQIVVQIGDSTDNSHQVKNPLLPGGYYIDLEGDSGYTDASRTEVIISSGSTTLMNIAPLTGDLVLSGRASPNAVIYVYESDSLLGTANADETGNFSKTLTGMSLGLHTIGLWCRDTNNNDSETLSYQFNISQSQNTQISGIMFPPTNSDVADQIKRSAPLWLNGLTFSYGKVRVSITSQKDNINLDSEANQDGTFNVDINPKLHLGSKNYSEITYDGYGSASGATSIKNFEVVRTSDINNDEAVDVRDLEIYKLDYGETSFKNVLNDINDDEKCDLSDLSIMMYDWSK